MGDLISGLFGVIQLIFVGASNLFKTSSEGSSAFNEALAATWGGGSTAYRIGFVLGIVLWIYALERLGKAKRGTSEPHSECSDSDQKNPRALTACGTQIPHETAVHPVFKEEHPNAEIICIGPIGGYGTRTAAGNKTDLRILFSENGKSWVDIWTATKTDDGWDVRHKSGPTEDKSE